MHKKILENETVQAIQNKALHCCLPVENLPKGYIGQEREKSMLEVGRDTLLKRNFKKSLAMIQKTWLISKQEASIGS